MTDDDRGVEVAQLQSVMHRIQSSLRDVPMAQREYIANALLNLAVSRMVKEEGSALTASILLRLGDVVANSDGTAGSRESRRSQSHQRVGRR
jgi:hypothetical protein